MSEFPTEPLRTPPPVTPPIRIDTSALPETDRLAVLYAAYPAAKAAADEAAANLKAITDGIKVELTARGPEGTADFTLAGPGGTPLRLDWRVSRRFDSKAFAKDHGALYEQYRKPGGSWTLSPVKPQAGD